MRYFIRRIVNDVQNGENIDLAAAVLLAIIIAILDILGVASPDLVASVTLVTLGLLAVGFLGTRYKLEEIYRESDTHNTVHLTRGASPSLVEHLKSSKEIWMLGLALRGTTIDNYHHFMDMAQNSGKVRAIVVNPDKVDLDVIARRFLRGATPQEFRTDLEHTISRFKKIREAARMSDSIELRLLDLVPSYSLYIFPHEEDGGVMYVEIYGYKSRFGSMPKFQLKQHGNPDWYKYFVEQYEELWKDAVAITR